MSWCWVVVVVVVVVAAAVVVDVVDVVVVVVVVAVARCFVGAHARQTSPQILTLLARAPTYAERMFGSPQTKPKPCYLRCFCSKRENKN